MRASKSKSSSRRADDGGAAPFVNIATAPASIAVIVVRLASVRPHHARDPLRDYLHRRAHRLDHELPPAAGRLRLMAWLVSRRRHGRHAGNLRHLRDLRT